MAAQQVPKYPSIENTYRAAAVRKVRDYLPAAANGPWFVQEKIHGANLRVYLAETATLVGSRNILVSSGPGDSPNKFYGSQRLVYTIYYGCFRNVYEAVRAQTGATSVVVYGELYGGAYPHKAVPRDPASPPVQGKGPFYCPSNEICVFDLLADGRFLPTAEANQLFEQSGLPYAKTLFKGSLDECLAFPCAFPTTVSGRHGLPAIPDNLCEGVVLRPAQPASLRDGTRVIFKNVNPRFRERVGARRRPPPSAASEAGDRLSACLREYVTAARLAHVVSHCEAPPTAQDTGTLIRALNADALGEFRKDYGAEFAALPKQQRNQITKRANTAAAVLVRAFLAEARAE